MKNFVQFLKGIGGLGCFRRKFFALSEKITAVLNDIVNRKINQTKIGLLISLHEIGAKMIDGREAIVIIRFGEVFGEDWIAFNGA